MTTEYQVTVDWAELHRLAGIVSQAMTGLPTGVGHPFGGTYYPEETLTRLVSLVHAANRIAGIAWDVIHAAAERIRSARIEQEGDYDIEYWAVGGPLGERLCRSHRGAAWTASVYGGVVERRPILRHDRIAARVERVLDMARRAVRTAIAVHHLRVELARIGLVDYYPETAICGITQDGRLNVTGLAWLAGHEREHKSPTLDAAVAFADGRPDWAQLL